MSRSPSAVETVTTGGLSPCVVLRLHSEEQTEKSLTRVGLVGPGVQTMSSEAVCRTSSSPSGRRACEFIRELCKDFPGGPGVKVWAFKAGGTGSIPGWRANIP